MCSETIVTTKTQQVRHVEPRNIVSYIPLGPEFSKADIDAMVKRNIANLKKPKPSTAVYAKKKSAFPNRDTALTKLAAAIKGTTK